MAATTDSFVLSDPEYEMVRHIIDIRVLEDSKWSDCCIYKVPCNLRKVNEEAYTPQLISVGPLHLGREQLQAMQQQKQRYFHFFCNRVSNEEAIKGYKAFLEENEPYVRHVYAEKFPGISKEKFIDMVLLDAVFVMELLLRNSCWKSDTSRHEHEYVETKSFRRNHSDDYILTQPWLSKNISRDLILLENQLPFFVLNKLYDTVVPKDNKKEKHSCFVDLALEYFAFYDTQTSSSDETKLVMDRNLPKYFSGSLRGSKKSLDKSMKSERCMKPSHFTDLIRYFYLPADLGDSGKNSSVLRNATKLQESGVSFEKVTDRRLLDITFDKNPILSRLLCLGRLPYLKHFKARFHIPQLKVDHTTECVLRNLIAFEQCHYPAQPYICNYVSLVDSLIHTKDDVELLVEKEVIVHDLGSDKEVATLVNGLCKQVVANSTCYYNLIDDLNKHYQSIWNRTMAALWLVYFRDPWRASSTVVGIAVLVFTIFNFCRVIRVVF